MSFVLYGLAAFLIIIVVYLLGVRFVGKPMAVYSWRYWHESPEMRPTVASILLFPFSHAVPWFESRPFSRSDFIPMHGYPDIFMPIIVGQYKTENRSAYIRNASWAWPLRLSAMTSVGAAVLILLPIAAFRWLMCSSIGRRILGAIKS